MKRNKRKCYFTTNTINHIDFRDVHLLSRFVDTHGKVFARRRTGTSASFQRQLDRAIKRARYMALMPYIKR